ncbi:MAG TPA: protein kinase [Kofleriaceae bacterium]
MSEGEGADPGRLPAEGRDGTADTVETGRDATVAIPGGSARARQPDTLLGRLRQTDPTIAVEMPPLPAAAYEIGPEVARGGMGRVVRAIDHRLGRVVALKLLLGNSPDLRARFAREAQITAGLQHPSIVPIYEAGTWPDGNLAYAMKLVSGQSLEAALQGSRSLEERLALLPQFIDVVDAVAYAHSERVVHRDIKPSNIILGEFGETILIDWGVAKSLDVEEEALAAGLPIDSEASRLTALGAVVGTPVYMPPEQAAGDTIDDRADVYALGAVLYQLLTGRLPYTGATPLEVLRKVVLGPPPALESIDPHIPAELAAVVARAMARERDDRYSAAELAAELRRFTTGKLVAAYHYSARERLFRWARRHRAAVSVAAAALAVLVAVAAVSARRIVRERDRARASDRVSRALVADQYAEQGRVLLLAGDRLRALAYLFAAARAGAGGPALDFMLARAAHAVEQKRFDLVGHRGPVPFIAFDAGGKRIVTTSDDGTARVWDAETGRQLMVLAGHTAEVNGAALRPEAILTFGNDGTARLWDPATGAAVRTLSGNRAPILGGRFRDDGRAIATTAQDGMVRVFDAASGRQQVAVQAHAGPARDARFDPAGRIWSCGEDGVVAVWRADGTPVRRLALDRGPAMGIAMDGSRVAVLLTSGAVALFEGEAGEPRLIDLGEELHAVVRTSRLALFAGRRLIVPVNRAVQIIDLDSGRRLFALTGHAGEVSMVAASADGARLATSGADGSARVWSAADGRLLSILPTVDHVRTVAFSPAGDLLATAGFAGAAVWAPSLDPPNRTLSGHPTDVFSVRFDPSGTRVVSAGEDGTIRLWDVATGRQLAVARAGSRVFHASFDPTGSRIVSADESGVATLWRADTLERIATVGAPAGAALMGAVYAPDGSAIATASDDGIARIADAKTGALRLSLRHTGPVNAIELDPTGRRVVTATQDRTARVWDAHTGAPLLEVPLDGPGVSATFSPDGRRFMVAARRAARIFDAETGRLIASLEGHQREVSSARFASDGLAVTSGYDLTVKVWDALTGRELSSFEGHRAWVSWIDIDRASRRIVSSDLGGGIVIWDLARATETPARIEQLLGSRVPFAVQNGLLVPRALR